MKKLFFVISVCLLFSCFGGKKVVEQTENTTPIVEKITVPKQQVKAPIEITEKKKEVPATPPKETPKIIKTFNHQSWTVLLRKHVSLDGSVNYKGFKEDIVSFRKYLRALGKSMPNEHWGYNEKLAYWLNVYNAYTIKLIVDHYPIKSIKDIKNPWDLRFFKLGEKWYTLNDVEHRILRRMREPRIHFGINCASFSCPPLLNKAFTARNVDQELEKLSVTFINNPKQNQITANKIQISKIFSWFAKDFKRNGSLIDYLNKYSKVKISAQAKKSYIEYDWNLNE